jgi:hypothetical protein
MTWPPQLSELKTDRDKTNGSVTAHDDQLQQVLDAAVAYVERVRAGSFNFDGDLGSELPEPSADLVLGTLRLAGRWHTRRRSPDMTVDTPDAGFSRIPSIDPDIERLLGIGRAKGPVFA